jgi:hypothetical protein
MTGMTGRLPRCRTQQSINASCERLPRRIDQAGELPLGYAVKDQKIVVVEEDVALVRSIFQLYLELGSLNLLMNALRKRGIRTKVQRLESGRTIGGIPFTRGPLSYLLRNRFFVGEVVYKGEVLPGKVDLLAAFMYPLCPQIDPYCTRRQGLNDLAVAISPRRSRIPNLADPWFES